MNIPKWNNEALTRYLVDKISDLPPPVKMAVGLLPGGGTAVSYADTHRWSILKLADHYAKAGKLDVKAQNALRSYKQALSAEQKTYNQLLDAIKEKVDGA